MPRLKHCLLFVAALLLVNCAHTRKVQLESVAKDWCMVIRASQVIPVYPLTEDLQPGDIFLVQMPIDQQQRAYEVKGFLPLDNLVYRLNPSGYVEFYERSFEVGGQEKELPRFWLEPGKTTAWTQAPDAAFPSYNFTVRRGVGFSLALPVQGVPVGLSLLGSDSANGSISIADARTYGVDTVSLYDNVREWAQKNQHFLMSYQPTEKKKNYLRVISRVYLTGKLNVSLEDASSGSAGVSAGISKPVDLLVQTTDPNTNKVTMEKYTENLDKLNQMISKALGMQAVEGAQSVLPGGTLKVAAASARSITLVEEFDRPLVIGYLGFDLLIDKGGLVGPPFPTHAVLVQGVQPTGFVGFTEVQRTIRQLLRRLEDSDDPDSARSKVVEELAGEVQTVYNMYIALDDSAQRRADLFRGLMTLYLAGESGGGPHHEKLQTALEKALR